MKKNKKIFLIGFAVLIVIIFFVSLQEPKNNGISFDYKNTKYLINGRYAKIQKDILSFYTHPNTRYFGNELKIDLNNDSREDVVFLITQQVNDHIFYYVVAAINTEQGYIGSDGYLLGDRIAPQTTEISRNPRHKNVVVINYADRSPNEPITTKPSVGKSVYLKLDPTSMQWGIVEPNFEGE